MPLSLGGLLVSTIGDLQHQRDNTAAIRPVRFLTAFGLFLLVLLCGAFAANPSLHELIHHDAEDSGHECAISLFARGQVHFAEAPPILRTPDFISFEAASPAPFLILQRAEYLLLPGRAPPVPLS